MGQRETERVGLDRAEDGLDVGHGPRCYAVATLLRSGRGPRRRGRGRGEEELDDRRRPALEIGRPVGVAGLDPLEEEPVEQGEEAPRHRVDIEPGRQLAADHALAQQQLAGAGQAFPPAGQHLADARLTVGLGPCLDE